MDSLVGNASAQLILPGSSTLTNTGTITVNGTVSGGGRFLRGNIANSGTVTINETRPTTSAAPAAPPSPTRAF